MATAVVKVIRTQRLQYGPGRIWSGPVSRAHSAGLGLIPENYRCRALSRQRHLRCLQDGVSIRRPIERCGGNTAAGDLSVDTVGDRANSYWNEEKQFHANFGRSSFSGWSFWLREHLALGRLLNRIGLWPGSQDIDYEIDKRWAEAHPDHGAVCEDAGRETVLTTAYRLAGLDLDEPRNAEGLRITKDLLSQMQNEVSAKQVKLIVLLLPTKESVYAKVRSAKMPLDPTYQKLVDMEGRIRSEIISTCQAQRIECVDALPYLSSALERGERLYPTTTESHPNARGYLVIASAVNENLSRLGL